MNRRGDNISNQEIRIAADELIQQYGAGAAHKAADWANDAFARGQTAKYEFWQWVCMDINNRDFAGKKKRLN